MLEFSLKKDVLLIAANNLGSYRSSKIVAENLAIGSLSAFLEENGIGADTCDARTENYSPSDIISKYDVKNYKIIGVSLFSLEAVSWCNAMMGALRRAGSKALLVVGGYYPTLNFEKVLSTAFYADVALIGEGEITLLELSHKVLTGQSYEDVEGIVYRGEDDTYVRTRPRKLIEDLDALPFARRMLHKYVPNFDVLIAGSRGCPNDCSFCSIKGFYRTQERALGRKAWRFRSAKSLVEEIEFVLKEYPNMKTVRFVDPDFLGTPQEGYARAREFVSLIEEKNLKFNYYIETRVQSINEATKALLADFKKMGLCQIYLGIENGNCDVLKAMNKGIKPEQSIDAVAILNELDIDCIYGFIMFTPWTTKEDVLLNISFLKKIGRVEIDKIFHQLNLIPQTKWYKKARNEGLLVGMNSLGYYDYVFLDPFVEKIVSIWKVIGKEYVSFKELLWWLSKDIKQCKAYGLQEVASLEKALSDFTIAFFEKIIDIAEVTVDFSQIREKISDLVEDGKKKIGELQNSIKVENQLSRNIINRNSF